MENEIILYHGSKSKFDEFDDLKISSGEGSDLFGKGFYLTDNESIAKFYGLEDAKKKYIIGYEPKGIFGADEPVYEKNADEKASKEYYVNKFKVSGNILDAEKFIIDDDFKEEIVKLYSKYQQMPLDFSKETVKRVMDFVRSNSNKITNFRGELEYVIKQLGMGNKDFAIGISDYIKSLGYVGVKYPSDKSYEGIKDSYNYVIYNKSAIKPFENGGESKSSHKSLGSLRELSMIPKIKRHDMIAKCGDCGEKFSYEKSKSNILWECPKCNSKKDIS